MIFDVKINGRQHHELEWLKKNAKFIGTTTAQRESEMNIAKTTIGNMKVLIAELEIHAKHMKEAMNNSFDEYLDAVDEFAQKRKILLETDDWKKEVLSEGIEFRTRAWTDAEEIDLFRRLYKVDATEKKLTRRGFVSDIEIARRMRRVFKHARSIDQIAVKRRRIQMFLEEKTNIKLPYIERYVKNQMK